MNRSRGFTLVELLVVIAIITILASIVVPKVTSAIDKSRAAKALSEIKGADLAITKMLADADKQGIDKFFAPGALASAVTAVANADLDDIYTVERVYSDIFYELLRRGKDAVQGLRDIHTGLVLQESVRRKLGTSYMEIGMDPWGTFPYFFYAGPLAADPIYHQPGAAGRSPFRCHRINPVDENLAYIYDTDAKAYEDSQMRGNPAEDGGPGYPSPKDLPVYIWSYGGDELSGQGRNGQGGGDDINNWDSAAGWSAFY